MLECLGTCVVRCNIYVSLIKVTAWNLIYINLLHTNKLFQFWISHAGSIPRQNHIDQRQSWVTTNYSSIWFLWWVFKKIWNHHSMAILHRNFWLPITVCYYWWQGKKFVWACWRGFPDGNLDERKYTERRK